ncbi:dipeptidase [Angustibacter sp. McL0619]|uniref:dipeptidase n=1 Tax=Angustibacter sp. McL0619 TaxID=3415676 RepID=UPI003CF5789B
MDLDAVRGTVHGLMPRARAELSELVAIPSVADARQYPPSECARAAQWVLDAFAEVGLEQLRLERTPDGSDAVVGHVQGPDGAPTVLLYAHYDVQPPLDDAAWQTPPFELTERDGRWYGRGTADCKGNILMHLTALRTLRALDPGGGAPFPVTVRLVVEGSEEQGTGGLEKHVEANPATFAADVIVVADTGNAEVGVPTVTTTLRGLANVVVSVQALAGEVHSGMFGGPAPDALAALVHILSSLRDERGNTTIDGLDATATWTGVPYPVDQFRKDAGVLDGVDLLGDGMVADVVWARPAVTVLGIDCPPVVGSAAAIQAKAAARLNLRVPPGQDAKAAQQALVAHLTNAAPWGVKVTVTPEAEGQPFRAATDGPAYTTLAAAMSDAYGRDMASAGQGGSIPLCNVFADTYPGAEIVLLGVEEPACLIHAPNESVHPSEIEHMAIVEALFLARLGGH